MGWRQAAGVFVVGLGLAGPAALASCNAPADTLADGGLATPTPPGASSPSRPTPPPSDATAPTPGPDATPTEALAAPPPSTGAPTRSTAKHAFAIRVLFLGDTNRTSVASPDAWRTLGYDLDGRASGSTSADHCALRQGADPRVRADGERGIDNTFGAHVLPQLVLVDPALSRATNEALAAGRANTLLEVTGLDLDPTQTASQLGARAFTATSRTSRPAWNGGDELSVLPSALVDGTTFGSGAKATFREAYVSQGVVVARAGVLHVRVPTGQGVLPITIRNATVSFKKPTAGVDTTDGTIAGTVDVEELLLALRAEAGRISTMLCEGTRYDDLAESIRLAADMLTDGSNTPGTSCDALSIGLGFVATEIRPLGAVAGDPAPPADPCQ